MDIQWIPRSIKYDNESAFPKESTGMYSTLKSFKELSLTASFFSHPFFQPSNTQSHNHIQGVRSVTYLFSMAMSFKAVNFIFSRFFCRLLNVYQLVFLCRPHTPAVHELRQGELHIHLAD